MPKASLSRSGLESLVIYRDFVDSQTLFLSACNKVRNACLQSSPQRLLPAESQEIMALCNTIFQQVFMQGKILLDQFDAILCTSIMYKKTPAAKHWAKKASDHCKLINIFNRATMKTAYEISKGMIEHLGIQGEGDEPDYTPAVDPKAPLDVKEYIASLRTCRNDVVAAMTPPPAAAAAAVAPSSVTAST